MFTADDFLKPLSKTAEQNQKPIPTISDIQVLLLDIDQTTILKSFQDRIEMRIWDKTSNINAATPDYILENNPWADVIYMLLINGELVYLQSHIPFVQGYQPITNENLKEVSDNHILEISKDAAFNQIVSEIWNELG